MCQKDLDFMIKSGNHKSAISKESEATLLKNYEKEVERDWMLLITFESVRKVKGAGVIPVGVATQMTIDHRGSEKVKHRTTHDASSPPPLEQFINNYVFRELLTTSFYCHCLIRILCTIHIMRWKCPTIRIMICKLDLDAA